MPKENKMTDTKKIIIGWDLSSCPSVTARAILMVRADGSIAHIPVGTEIDIPVIRNVRNTCDAA